MFHSYNKWSRYISRSTEGRNFTEVYVGDLYGDVYGYHWFSWFQYEVSSSINLYSYLTFCFLIYPDMLVIVGISNGWLKTKTALTKSAIEAFEFEIISENISSGNTERENLAPLRNSIFRTPVRERLQIFLQSSDMYDPKEVLDLIEGSELWLEKVILSPLTVLSKICLF